MLLLAHILVYPLPAHHDTATILHYVHGIGCCTHCSTICLPVPVQRTLLCINSAGASWFKRLRSLNSMIARCLGSCVMSNAKLLFSWISIHVCTNIGDIRCIYYSLWLIKIGLFLFPIYRIYSQVLYGFEMNQVICISLNILLCTRKNNWYDKMVFWQLFRILENVEKMFLLFI